MEQELKYQIVNRVSAERYQSERFWQHYALSLRSLTALQMHARYYDTPLRELAAIHSSLRIRQEGTDVFLTLKYEPDGDARTHDTDALFVREEWEWPLSYQDNTAYEEAAWRILEQHLDDLPVKLSNIIKTASWSLLYEARFQRKKADLLGDDVRFELAIDTGHLAGAFAKEEICEMEVELKGGDLDSLMSLHGALLEEKDIAVQPLSKAARLNRLSTADLLIVGAGASGLMAAISYREENPDGMLLLLEGQSKAAKKLTATGNGRGNISNIGLTSANYHQTTSATSRTLIEKQLASCSPEELCQIFYGLGLLTRVEANRVYPFSYQAKTVSDLLIEAVSGTPNTHVLYETRTTQVDDLSRGSEEKLYRVLSDDGRMFFSRQVLLTCGGRAAPKSGSDGHGYEMLNRLGHTITPLYPGLVQLMGKGLPKRLNGQRVQARLTIIANEEPLATDFGEILLTDYGLSGIPVLNLSHLAARALHENKDVYAVIDLAGELVYGELEAFVDRRIFSYPNMPARQFALGFLGEKLSSAIVSLAGIPEELPLGELDADSISQLLDLCRNLKMKITDTKGYDFAQVTCGGASCDEFDPQTLESKLHAGLYASGEILDVYGDCGGYNLHFAFVSGMNAGRAAAGIAAGQ